MIKRFFVPLMLTPCEDQDESCFVIKRQNTFMCFSMNKLRFLDVKNYLAPGVSYKKYLKAYGCSVQKGHFPYKCIDDLQKLEEHSLPPQAAFFSRLKTARGISDTDYALCQEAWRSSRMTTMHDFLVFTSTATLHCFSKLSTNSSRSTNSRTSTCSKMELAFRSDVANAIPVQRSSTKHVLHSLQPDQQRFTSSRQRQHRRRTGKHSPPYHEKNVTNIRVGETC